jgi:fatty acid-binding protein DegV
MKSFIARSLDLKPIISLNSEGKSVLLDKSFSEKGCMKKLVKNVSRIIRDGKVWEYAITHANNSASANWYAEELEKLTGKKPAFIDHASPAIVANTGPGVVCVSLMME